MGSLPFNLQQHNQMMGFSTKNSGGYQGSKIQNPKVMVTSHGSDILSTQFSAMRGSNTQASYNQQAAQLSFKSGGPIRAFDSGIYMGGRSANLGQTDLTGASRKQTQT